jgi:hypothetical protein
MIIAVVLGYSLLTIIFAGSKSSFADSINPGVFALGSKPYGVSNQRDMAFKDKM